MPTFDSYNAQIVLQPEDGGESQTIGLRLGVQGRWFADLPLLAVDLGKHFSPDQPDGYDRMTLERLLNPVGLRELVDNNGLLRVGEGYAYGQLEMPTTAEAIAGTPIVFRLCHLPM